MKVNLILILALFCSLISSKIIAQSHGEINLTQSQKDDRHPFFSPDGSKIIFASNRDGNWQIYTMSADGSDQKRLTESKFDDRMPSWHPSGKSIIFQSNRSGKIQLHSLDLNSQEVKLVEMGKLDFEPEFPRYSHKGDQIIFTAKFGNGNHFNLFLFNFRNQQLEQITFDSSRSVYGSFLPDDKAIIFHSRRDTKNEIDEIYIQYLQSNTTQRMTYLALNNTCPSVSPDGQKIAYVSSMDQTKPELYIMDISGKNSRRLTFNEDNDTQPEWSPDGRQIVFTSHRNGNFEICMLQLEVN